MNLIQSNISRVIQTWVLVILLSLGILVPSAQAQEMPRPQMVAQQVSTKAGPAIKLTVQIAPGWHITSNNPKDEFAFGAEVEFKDPNFQAGQIQWPLPIVKFIESIGVENSYYEGEITILIPLNRFPNKIQGQEIVLHYQSCTEELCLAPDFISTLIW